MTFSIDIERHIKQIADLSYYKGVQPNALDTWPFWQSQMYVSNMIKLFEEEMERKKKQAKEEERQRRADEARQKAQHKHATLPKMPKFN